MPIQATSKIWHNGNLIPWEQANIHVMSHVIHYGSSVFEGIRCYAQPQGSAVFRLPEHMQRLLDSAKIYRMELPFTLDELCAAVVDVIEANEAFAAQVLAVRKELDLPPEKTNPNGSGISLGHPIGATGAIVTVKAIHELNRIGGKYALVTMCIGGGQGIAAIFQSMN